MATKTDIDLYTAGTPNGHKISCTLEELGVQYTVHKIDISKNTQKEEWFLKINRKMMQLLYIRYGHDLISIIVKANGRIPAIVDKTDGRQPKRVFEGASIQLYLCQRYDPNHQISFPYDSDEYWEMVEWMVWMQSGIGPMQGQANHFYRYAPEKIQYAITRYQNETKRLYQVLDDRLSAQSAAGQGAWLVGGKYTVADLCCFSWVNWASWAGIDTAPFPTLRRWVEAIEARPAVRRGVDVPTKFELKEAMRDKDSEEAYAKHHSGWVMKGMQEDAEKHGK